MAGRPRAAAGLAAVAGGQALMVAVMVMTPVHLGDHGATLRVVGLVLSLHIAGMYALSPVVGWASDRFGALPVIGTGVLVLGAAAVTGASAAPMAHTQVAVALTLLGLGWSCTMVAGSALLSASVPTEVRTQVQGAGDLVVGVTAACAGALAGPVLELAGYAWLNLAALVVLVPVVATALLARRVASGTRVTRAAVGVGSRPARAGGARRPGEALRAVVVRASPGTVFRWLCQLSVAPYSYDLLDNLGRRSPRTLTPGADRLVVGQPVMAFVLDAFEQDRSMTLRTTGRAARAAFGDLTITYRTDPHPDGTLLSVSLALDGEPSHPARLRHAALAWGDLPMMRKQLVTLRDRGGTRKRFCLSGSQRRRSSRPRTKAACPACCAASSTTLTSRAPRVTGGSQSSSTTSSSAASSRVVR